MAAPVRTEDPRLALEVVGERLFREPCSFSFFQAVRLLERLFPSRAPVGRYANPQQECVRFASNPTLNFPASEIQSLENPAEGHPRMTVNFMGLTGPIGALPNYMTELVGLRARARDTALRDFLDLFNHRLISFFYQAWQKHHFTIAYERDGSDPLTECLLCLVGLGTPGLRGRQAVRDESLVYYAGLLGPVPRSAVALESILTDYFGVPFEVVPFVGTWRKLGASDQCIFGEDTESTELGLGVIVGDEMWDQQSRVRLRIGPLTIRQYRDFLPVGSAYPALRALTRTYCGNDIEFEVQLILRGEDVPACRVDEEVEESPRLGWSTWVKSRKSAEHDRDDAVFLLTEA
jgi:type VI secretion system protein ImpH